MDKKLMNMGELIEELQKFDPKSPLRIIIDSSFRLPFYPIINNVYPDPDIDCADVLIEATIPNDDPDYFK